MKVLYATAECWPFAKTGGLGDVSYALPKSLKKEGIDVRVILPKNSTMPNYLKEQLKEVAVFSVDVGWRKQYCGLLEMDLNGVKFYFFLLLLFRTMTRFSQNHPNSERYN